jgi:hypothetical protein
MRIFGACVLAITLVAVGCAASEHEDVPDTDTTTASSARERTVDVSLCVSVPDLASAARGARSVVAAHGGYVELASEAATSGGRATFELRVPAADVDDVREALGDLGTVASTHEESVDVTDAHLDLSARLASAHAERARLVELMAIRTDDLADVLAVERELARVSESIEQLDAQERDLRAQVAMARVSLELVPLTADFTTDPIARLTSAVGTGITVASALALALGMGAAAFGPSLLLLALLVLAVRRVRRAFPSNADAAR